MRQGEEAGEGGVASFCLEGLGGCVVDVSAHPKKKSNLGLVRELTLVAERL